MVCGCCLHYLVLFLMLAIQASLKSFLHEKRMKPSYLFVIGDADMNRLPIWDSRIKFERLSQTFQIKFGNLNFRNDAYYTNQYLSKKYLQKI